MIRRTCKKVFDYHNWYASAVYMFIIAFVISSFVPQHGWANTVGWVIVIVLANLLGSYLPKLCTDRLRFFGSSLDSVASRLTNRV